MPTRGPHHGSALHDAAADASAHEVSRLIAEGYDLDKGDKDRFTPLHVAAMRGRADVARVLLDAGADVDAKDRWGNTPLGRALTSLHQHPALPAMVVLLRARGADPYCDNCHGSSPISYAYLVANYDLKALFADLPAPDLSAP